MGGTLVGEGVLSADVEAGAVVTGFEGAAGTGTLVALSTDDRANEAGVVASAPSDPP